MTIARHPYRLKRPTITDALSVLELQNAVDMAEYGEPDSDLDDLLQEWGEIDLEKDAWLAYTPEGALAGYASVQAESVGYKVDFYAHPVLGSLDLRDRLISECEARARALEGRNSQSQAVHLESYISHDNHADRLALERRGYAPYKFHLRMQIEMESAFAPPMWPDGCSLRTINPGRDDRLVFEFVDQAFARPDRIPPTFERWQAYMQRSDHFIPELWFLLFCGHELIAVALCFDYQVYGWVRQLAVKEDWRRRGVGTAMLQHVFGVFFNRGRRRVALGVESQNERATALYERIGMQRVRQYDQYAKGL